MSLFLGLVFLPLAKQVLQEVGLTPEENRILRRLTRRRRRLVNEKTRVLNNLQADLQAVCPNLLAITNPVYPLHRGTSTSSSDPLW